MNNNIWHILYRLLLWTDLQPLYPHSYAEALTYNVTQFGHRVSEKSEGRGLNLTGLVSLREEVETATMLLPCTHAQRNGQVREEQEEGAICKPGREPTRHLIHRHLSQELLPPELWENKCVWPFAVAARTDQSSCYIDEVLIRTF